MTDPLPGFDGASQPLREAPMEAAAAGEQLPRPRRRSADGTDDTATGQIMPRSQEAATGPAAAPWQAKGPEVSMPPTADSHAPGRAPASSPEPVVLPEGMPAAADAARLDPGGSPALPSPGAPAPRNIVLIAVDDLNAYASILGGYAGPVHMPNLDRLAAEGTSFTSAHAPTPLCGPARASVLTGMSPFATGIFSNVQFLYDSVRPEQSLPAQLQAAGYTTVNAGKVFHALPPEPSSQIYDVVLSTGSIDGAERGNTGLVRTMTSVPGGIYTGDPALLGDARTVSLVEGFLAGYAPAPGDAGLFLSIGLTSPHGPRYVPQAYYDLYPLESIILPETPPGDLDDLPAYARSFIGEAQFQEIVQAGDWRAFVQAYLATLSYMDAMLGRLMAAIEASAIGGDAVIALWSDHGTHLGEKQTTGKVTMWDESTRAPLLIVDPLADPSRIGARVDTPVSTLNLYTTLLDYAGAPRPAWAEGESLVGIVQQGDASGLAGAAVTVIDGNLSLRTEQWRYTLYEDGSEELYDVVADPDAYFNLAGTPALAGTQASLAASLNAWAAENGYQGNRSATPTTLTGGEGRDVLVAGFGADTLEGGPGDDVYLLRLATQQVREAPGGGRDQVLIGGDWSSYVLPDEVEDIYFERNGGNVRLAAQWTITGNDLDNIIKASGDKDLGGQTPMQVDAGAGNDEVFGSNGPSTLSGGLGDDTLLAGDLPDILSGGSGDDSVQGRGGADTISGGAGQDNLAGNDGADSLDGGEGNDLLTGGDQGDTYRASAGTDRIAEAGSSGIDILDISDWGRAATRVTEQRDALGRLLSVTYARSGTPDSVLVPAQGGANPIELLLDNGLIVLAGTQNYAGGSAADRIDGSALGDRIDGAAGADALGGLGGNDTLSGGLGNDTLDGGKGADSMAGGPDDDRYVVDDAGDVLAEAAGGGRDEVWSSVSWTLGALFEALVLTGTAAIRGAGNGGDNTLTGNAAANRLDGGAGNDVLTGGAGADTLVGGAGADTMTGGTGDDTFLVDDVADVVRERAGGGLDLVQASVSYTLPGGQEIERLTLTGTAANGAGNGTANTITGNAAANRLDGAGGADTLAGGDGADTLLGGEDADRLLGGPGTDSMTGGSGADVFVFAAPDGEGDRIRDFTSGADRIELGAAGFPGLPPGVLPAANFVAHASNAATAPAGTAQVIHQTDTGQLWFDADGIGAAAAPVRFALLLGLPPIMAGDILVA